MTQNIKNQCIFVHKFDIKITWLNLYGIMCVYDFPSQYLATCASAGVSELFLSTHGFAILA